jgi:hypothetical protein
MTEATFFDAMERRIFRSIPEDIRACLSEQQVQMLIRAVKPIPTRHGIALRASFRWIEKRYYVAMFWGEDNRNIERLKAEGQTDVIPVGITFFILLSAIAAYAVMPIAIGLYMIKSMLGIDLFDGPSPLHQLMCN